MQSFNEGSLDARTWELLLSHRTSAVRRYHVYQDLLINHQLEKNLLLKKQCNKTMDKHAVKVVKGDETVGHLPHKFSRIVWYFLARSGEISVEVISCRRCGRIEVPWQLDFNFSNKVQMKLLKELLASKSRV